MVTPAVIHGLPVEILIKIFVHCIFGYDFPALKLYHLHPSDPRRTLTYLKYPTPLSFLLSHVCSLWRDVALSSPLLWTLLETPADGRCTSSKPIINLLRLCISRSGNLPLSIYVCSTLEDGDGSQGFMKAIADHLHRVENMTLTFWRTDTPFTRIYGDAPSLRILKLESIPESMTNLKFPFSSCPMLRHLQWPHSSSLLGSDIHIIPWAQLTHLRLGFVSTRQTISLFSYCPRLIEIHYKISSSLLPDPGPGPDHRCKHKSLRKLVFIFEPGTNINAIMNYILLPKLTFLQLEIEHTLLRDDPLSTDCLKNFLELSECRLLHLELTHLNYHSGELQSILQTPVCSGLTTLKITAHLKRADIELTGDLLTRLTCNGASTTAEVICPDLQTMFFMNYTPSSTHGGVGKMVASRFKYGDLEHFAFYPLECPAEDKKILRSYANAGYDVRC
ncbi:hypothetical protein APHAL10511_004175 [Amanita phalloides]|nr:hypothetical protein APHAL10511_004175 [Amanita phalloides]